MLIAGRVRRRVCNYPPRCDVFDAREPDEREFTRFDPGRPGRPITRQRGTRGTRA